MQSSTYAVGVKRLVQLCGLVEEVDNLFLRLIVGVAIWVQGANAGTVLAPLMFPKGFVCAVVRVVQPIGVHVVEKRGSTVGFENGGDVCVLPTFVTVLTICTVAIVRPRRIAVSVIESAEIPISNSP